MSFLSGQKIENPNTHHCYQVGKQIANIHHLTKDFTLTRNNNLHQSNWRKIFNKCQESQDSRYNELFGSIEKELKYLSGTTINHKNKCLLIFGGSKVST